MPGTARLIAYAAVGVAIGLAIRGTDAGNTGWFVLLGAAAAVLVLALADRWWWRWWGGGKS